MVGVGFSSEDKVQEGREGRPRPDFERSAEVNGLHRPKQSSQEKVYRLLSRLNLDRTQAAIILCGFYSVLLPGRKITNELVHLP